MVGLVQHWLTIFKECVATGIFEYDSTEALGFGKPYCSCFTVKCFVLCFGALYTRPEFRAIFQGAPRPGISLN